jgi:hypothetical protein
MAIKMHALGAYRPRIVQGQTVQMPELVRFIAATTGLNEGSITHVILELRDSIVYYSTLGQAVKLPGLGTFTPTILLDGSYKVSIRPDPFLTQQLNGQGISRKQIANREHIGKSLAELIDLWNADHPEDPIG